MEHWVKCKKCGKAQKASETKILCEHTFNSESKRTTVDSIEFIRSEKDPSDGTTDALGATKETSRNKSNATGDF